MRKRMLLSLCLLCFVVTAGFTKKEPPRAALESIQAQDIRRDVDFLAADSMLGRDTPSPELDRAAAYIAAKFAKSGVKPVNGSYFYHFDLNKVQLGEENYLQITAAGQEKDYPIKDEYMPFDMTANKAVDGELVFAGYGITAPEYRYDDYAGLEVKNKIVLVFRHEPGEKEASSPFEGAEPTEYSQVAWKVQNAIDHGAAGVLVVLDPLNHRRLKARGFPWPSLFEFIPDEALPLTLAITESEKIPVVEVGEEFVQQVFTTIDSLRNWQAAIDRDLQPRSRELPGVRVRMKTATKPIVVPSRDVVGLIEGRDKKLKKEIVVLGAHYDHVGSMKDHQPGEDYIFNGADDNASGTSLLLALAKAFGACKEKPQRSILFIAFSGEEKGLLGSRAYVEKPLFASEQTVAMLNFDMVGRNAPDSLSIGGTRQSPDLVRINAEENNAVGLNLDYSIESYSNRSDQYNFARKKIPFLFYFTGIHADYHQVTDSPDKINADKIATIARLGFRVAWRISNTDEHFRFVE